MIEYYLAGWGPLFAPEISPLRSHEKGSGGPEPLSLCAPGSSGGDGEGVLLRDFFFGAEPVV